MIKLDSPVSGVDCRSLLKIESPGDFPSIKLTVEPVRKQVNGQWQDDPTRMKQSASFLGQDGPVELTGTVLAEQAVEISGAWRVVVEVSVYTKNLPTYDKGRVSQALLAVEVVKVVEVWASEKKCLYREGGAASAPTSGPVFDMTTGRTSRPGDAKTPAAA